MLKNKIKNGFRYIVDPEFRLLEHTKWGFYDNLPDEAYIKKRFKVCMGYDLDLDNPKTFNEKLQWLKLHNRKPEYKLMVDKYEAKKYVANIIGEQYIIPTLGVWDSFDEIDFNSLPDSFVLKCTHDSGGLVIVKDKSKLNKKEAKKTLTKALKRNFYLSSREWPYKDVKPRILAEKYMIDSELNELRDYKFFCFNGIPKFYKIDTGRFSNHHANYYDLNNNLLEIGETQFMPDHEHKLIPPKNLQEMISLSKKLSEGQPFLRVDFYEANGKTYFGELTFYPNTGLGEFVYDNNDKMLGEWIDISK